MRVKEENEKVGLKLNIQKTKITESGAITSWQIHREQWKQWLTLVGGEGDLKTTADGDRKHDIKRRLDRKLQPNYTAY